MRMIQTGKPEVDDLDKDAAMFENISHGEMDDAASPRNPIEELSKLSKFLGKDYDVSFLQAVSDACALDKMRSKKAAGRIWQERVADNQKFMQSFYRQGRAGGWKNWFTVAQSEHFDLQWSKAMEGSKIFRYG
nr:hypothetical protein BaRGS_007810 [Batillaria attramentaria]